MRGRRPSCIACRVIEKAPVMIDWLAITVATVASATSGSCSAAGQRSKKGFVSRADRTVHQQRGLAGVIEQQGRQDEAIPREAYRLAAEMTHVGIERLRARGAQKHSAERKKPARSVRRHVSQSHARIERPKHVGMAPNAREAQRADGEKPQRHDRAEDSANPPRSLRLQAEQADEDRDGQRDDIGFDRRRRGF